MIRVRENISLKSYNTFAISAIANTFIEVFSQEELLEALRKYPNAKPLGGGSNILLTKNVTEPLIKLSIKGIHIEKEDENHVWITAMAGENWNHFVQTTLKMGYNGLENLSLIYGNVGTAPVQNIGAYGVEIKDVMYSCQALNKQTLTTQTFLNADCHFAYRDSIFKKDKNLIITSVTFCLNKKQGKLHTQYGDISAWLQENHIQNPKAQDVAQAVSHIRQTKLPNPAELGNAGSFFKNPVVSRDFFEDFHKRFPEAPHHFLTENQVKIPAGWLIQNAGLKGFRQGDAGVHQRQSLVLVNYGEATGEQILALSGFIQQKIFQTYGISLETEVNIW